MQFSQALTKKYIIYLVELIDFFEHPNLLLLSTETDENRIRFHIPKPSKKVVTKTSAFS